MRTPFNESFTNNVPTLVTDEFNVSEIITSDKSSLTSIIKKYKQYPSITTIKNRMDQIEKPNFSFKEITKPIVVKQIKKVSPMKTSQSNDRTHK